MQFGIGGCLHGYCFADDRACETIGQTEFSAYEGAKNIGR